MTEWSKHKPVTYQEYLLKQQNELLSKLVDHSVGTAVDETAVPEVKLKEVPHFPSGFPHQDKLVAAGYMNVNQVPKKSTQLKKIPGIGPAAVNAIMTWQKLNS